MSTDQPTEPPAVSREPGRPVLQEPWAAGDIDPLDNQEHQRRDQFDQQAVQTRPSGDRSRMVITVAVILAVGLFLIMGTGFGGGWLGSMGWHMGSSTGTSGTVDTPVAGALTREVRAGDLWFEPETIRIPAGEIVNITVQNQGQVFHDLAIPELGFQVTVEPGDRVSGALQGAAAGEYEFLCTVPGHADAGMRGTLMVSSGS